jgi:hypothetical protein
MRCTSASARPSDAVVLVVAIALLLVPLQAQVIDRVLATVGGSLILQSDVAAASRFGLITPPKGVDALQWTLDRLIERRLMLTEVERYAPPEPERTLVDQRMQAIDERIGSADAFNAITRETGMTLEQLRRYVRDDLRLEAYLQQRFGGFYQPTEDEIVRYYRENAQRFMRGGVLLPFNEAREQVREAVMGERRAASVREWLAGLRRRTEVNIVYLGR